jgi:hypothetical protein
MRWLDRLPTALDMQSGKGMWRSRTVRLGAADQWRHILAKDGQIGGTAGLQLWRGLHRRDGPWSSVVRVSATRGLVLQCGAAVCEEFGREPKRRPLHPSSMQACPSFWPLAGLANPAPRSCPGPWAVFFHAFASVCPARHAIHGRPPNASYSPPYHPCPRSSFRELCHCARQTGP